MIAALKIPLTHGLTEEHQCFAILRRRPVGQERREFPSRHDNPPLPIAWSFRNFSESAR